VFLKRRPPSNGPWVENDYRVRPPGCVPAMNAS
jgi:hypothetical protein